MKRLFLAMIALCALSTSALAIDASSFAAKVGKHTSAGGTMRDLCICKQVGTYYMLAGYLSSAPDQIGSGTMVGIGVRCVVPLFYSTDNLAQYGTCTAFEVLGK
jgi:hypothetical protein